MVKQLLRHQGRIPKSTCTLSLFTCSFVLEYKGHKSKVIFHWICKQYNTASQASGGNPKSTEAHESMTGAASSLRDMTQDLLTTMEEAASAGGAVTAMVDNISKAIAKVQIVWYCIVFCYIQTLLLYMY